MANVFIELSREEVYASIPYEVICETRYGGTWDTGKRRRLWKEEFTEEERALSTRLFKQAHMWMLSTGVPEKVVMKTTTLALWGKLAVFCMSL